MQRIVLMSVILLSCGYGALEVGFPYFATKLVHVSERIVAFGYVGNTLAIVLGQLLVIRLIQGRRRTRVLQLVGVLWALSWVVLGLAVPAAGAIAVLLVVLSPIVFAVGETLFQPVAPAMVNDLAPEHLRGRYNTFGSLAWSISGMLGPAIAGALLGAGLGALWITTVTAGCLMASVLAFRIRAVLTPAQDGITTAEVAGSVLDAPTVQAMAGGEVRD
jgi:MFS family permease